MPRSRDGESIDGFTVLEAIIAFTILSLSLIAANMAYGLAISSLRKATELRQVTEIAGEVIVMARNIPMESSEGMLRGMRWKLHASGLPQNPDLRRLQIEIYAEDGHRLGHYLTFVQGRAE